MTDSARTRDSYRMPSETLEQSMLVASRERETALSVVPALTTVYQDYFKYVWRCLRSLGVDANTLDDAVQEVFLVVSRKLGEFDGRCKVSTWLYAIVLHVARRHRAAAATRARRIISDSAETFAMGAAQAHGDLRAEVEKNEQLALAQRALATLDDAKREVFVLACVEGMSAPEIADVTGVPLNTVYSRLRIAKQQFEQAVDELSQPQPNAVRSKS
jgi:RNA polymerase sigma-70 factor, ECF subfamily